MDLLFIRYGIIQFLITDFHRGTPYAHACMRTSTLFIFVDAILCNRWCRTIHPNSPSPQEPMPRPPPVSNLHTLALHFYQQFHKYERPLQVDLGPQGNGINNLRQKSNINTMENTTMQGGPQKHTLESYDSDGGQAPCTGTTTWMVFKIPFHNSL